MVAAGGDLNELIAAASASPIDNPVIPGNSPRPPPGEIAAQGLGFSYPPERASSNILQKTIDPL
jgi:hypothetical protein